MNGTTRILNVGDFGGDFNVLADLKWTNESHILLCGVGVCFLIYVYSCLGASVFTCMHIYTLYMYTNTYISILRKIMIFCLFPAEIY